MTNSQVELIIRNLKLWRDDKVGTMEWWKGEHNVSCEAADEGVECCLNDDMPLWNRLREELSNA